MILFIKYKKSILTGIGFLFFVAIATAQNAQRIATLLQQNNMLQAKEAVDSFVITSPNAPAYLLQAKVYNALANDENFKNITADVNATVFTALQKAVTLDKSFTDAQLKESGYQLTRNLYNCYTKDGILFYNAGVERNDKTSFATALTNFKKAGVVGEFIFSNGWIINFPDTNNLLHSAKSAIYSDNEIDAIFYCKKIIDNNYIDTIKLRNYESIFQWLSYYCKVNNQEVLFTTYSKAGLAKFPESVYFSLLQADWLRSQKRYPELLAVYASIFKQHPQNQQYRFAYLTDVFNYLYQENSPNSKLAAYRDTLKKGLLKLIATKPHLALARLLLAKHYANEANALDYEVLLLKSKDTKIIKAYKTRQINLLQMAIAQLIVLHKSFTGKPKNPFYEEVKRILNTNSEILRRYK